jgi:L-lactate dehydrogenase complex protein LldF
MLSAFAAKFKARSAQVTADLSEYIVQLREEAPYHLVFPAMHLTRNEISDLFQKKLHSAPTDNSEALTLIARRELRLKYLQADLGISGANFGIAETGMISITENEGNARLPDFPECGRPHVRHHLPGRGA